MANIDLKIFAVINMTLPDEKSNYVHRIGRVGRAERMGLAISLVSTVPEKVLLIPKLIPEIEVSL